jgi:hypothetical protein
MSKTWQKYANSILDFGPVVATVLAATFASLRAIQSSTTPSEMLQLVLVVLTLLATTQLIDRFRILRGIDLRIEQLIGLSMGQATARTFFDTDIPGLAERLREAETVAVNGLTLNTTISRYIGAFSECLSKKKGKVRIITVNRNHSAIEIAAARFHKHQNIESIKREARVALDSLKEKYENEKWGQKLEVRHCSFVPPYAIWLFDVDTPSADIYVWIYPFREKEAPVFHIVPRQDEKWYKYFKEQYDLMWDASEPWEVTSSAQIQPDAISDE